jgi:hypothetical protein
VVVAERLRRHERADAEERREVRRVVRPLTVVGDVPPGAEALDGRVVRAPDYAADPGVAADHREARDRPAGRERRAVLDVAVGEPAVGAPVGLPLGGEAEVLELERLEPEDVVRDETASAGRGRSATGAGERGARHGEDRQNGQEKDASHGATVGAGGARVLNAGARLGIRVAAPGTAPG